MRRVFKYGMIGGAAALIEWTIYWLFLNYTTVEYRIGFFIAFIISTGFHYILTVKYVFTESKFSVRREVFFVFVISGVGLIINTIALTVLVQYFFLNKMLSKILATGTAFGWNYLMRKHFVFAR